MARAGQAGLVLLWAALSVPPPGSSLQSFNISLLLLYNCSSSSYPRLYPSNTHKVGLASSTSLSYSTSRLLIPSYPLAPEVLQVVMDMQRCPTPSLYLYA